MSGSINRDKQNKQVLLTYLRRPMFWGLAAWTFVFALNSLWFLGGAYRVDGWEWLNFLLIVQFIGSFIFFPSILGAALVLHAKEQLENCRADLTPDYRRAHLAIFGVFFALSPVFITTIIFLNKHVNQIPLNGLAEALLFISSLMLASGWWASFRYAWTSALLGPLIVVAPLLLFGTWLHELATNTNNDVETISEMALNLVFLIIPPLLIAGFAALLWKLSRGSRRRRKTPQRFINANQMNLTSAPKATRTAKAFVHRPIRSFFARANRRRASFLGSRVIWVTVAFLGGVFWLMAKAIFVLSDNTDARAEALINAFITLITIAPCAIVVMRWRQRLPFLAAESLYPASRSKFLTEMAAALAVDFMLFWPAVTATALLSMLFFLPGVFYIPVFWIWIAASAVLQVFAYGVIVLVMSLRSATITTLASFIILGAMLFPIESTMLNFPFSEQTNILLRFQLGDSFNLSADCFLQSLAAGCIGIFLALIAYYRWRQIELVAR